MHDARERLPLSEEEWSKLKIKIEDLTVLFDEECVFKTAPNIIKILIKSNKENAKDYLKKRNLENADIEWLSESEFGQYTIEALRVHSCIKYGF